MGQPIYEKSAITLLKEFAQQCFARGETSFRFENVRQWLDLNYPEISDERIRTNLTILSTNSPARQRHPVHRNPANCTLFAQEDGSCRSYDATSDPMPLSDSIHRQVRATPDSELAVPESWKFEKERVLQSYLIHNLEAIEPGLILHKDSIAIGIEYPCGNRRIDILARDADRNWVVIELKADRAHDRVLGQIALYVEWIKQNVATPKERVRGIILAHRASNELRLAVNAMRDITLKEYSLLVTIQNC